MDAEVLVVGAGPVGSALTLMLRALGVRTMLVDRATFPRDKACGEGLMPHGSRLLAEVGVDLGRLGYPRIDGVRYRIPHRGWVSAPFSGPAYGVRRVRFDATLAELAGAEGPVAVDTISPRRDSVLVETDRGRLRCGTLVAADGMRSPIRRAMGWEDGGPTSDRYGMVGHLRAPAHGRTEIEVTLLDGVETYLAPAGPDELMVALLGARQRLHAERTTTKELYRRLVDEAHPELESARLDGGLRGAGPFGIRARRVASSHVFLCGDAAGFIDPLTGEAMSSGIAQAAFLARQLAGDVHGAAPAYARFFAAQWRRRRVMTGLVRAMTASPSAARRALRGIARRPETMVRLLEISDGTRGLGALRPADAATLAGW